MGKVANARPFSDGARRARTADLLGAIQALSQLSYSPSAAHCSVSIEGPRRPLQRFLIPAVDEVGMRPVAARRLNRAGSLGRGVEEDEREARHGDRVRARTAPGRGVRHVALVVGAVEIAPVPAVGEGRAQVLRLIGGQAGTAADRGSAPKPPHAQPTTDSDCGRRARELPAIIFSPDGSACTGPLVRRT